jgi:hypothetical protein
MPEPDILTWKDGAMSPRHLNAKASDAWISWHNPHDPESFEGVRWGVTFRLDQLRAINDPKRSRSTWLLRYILWPATGLVFVVLISINILLAISGG